MKKRTFNPIENHIDPQVKVSQLSKENLDEFNLNKDNCEWVKDLLDELNQNVEDVSDEDKFKQSHLNIKLKIGRKFKDDLGEYILMKTDIDGQFFTECVKTLQTMKDMVHFSFQACFIDKRFEEHEEYEDLTEIFTDEEVYELYFHSQALADIKETIHEQLYLNIDSYPTIESDDSTIN